MDCAPHFVIAALCTTACFGHGYLWISQEDDHGNAAGRFVAQRDLSLLLLVIGAAAHAQQAQGASLILHAPSHPFRLCAIAVLCQLLHQSDLGPSALLTHEAHRPWVEELWSAGPGPLAAKAQEPASRLDHDDDDDRPLQPQPPPPPSTQAIGGMVVDESSEGAGADGDGVEAVVEEEGGATTGGMPGFIGSPSPPCAPPGSAGLPVLAWFVVCARVNALETHKMCTGTMHIEHMHLEVRRT
jgi:hypothetical protein